MANWLVVARNEYRLRTSGIRRIRKYFHYIAILIIGLVVGVIAPAIANAVIDALDVRDFFEELYAIALMQVVLFLFFFYFMLFPISNTLKDIETQEYEIFISAPIKPGDVLLGKFIGVLPLYAIGIAIITGFFTVIRLWFIHSRGLTIKLLNTVDLVYEILVKSVLGQIPVSVRHNVVGELLTLDLVADHAIIWCYHDMDLEIFVNERVSMFLRIECMTFGTPDSFILLGYLLDSSPERNLTL